VEKEGEEKQGRERKVKPGKGRVEERKRGEGCHLPIRESGSPFIPSSPSLH